MGPINKAFGDLGEFQTTLTYAIFFSNPALLHRRYLSFPWYSPFSVLATSWGCTLDLKGEEGNSMPLELTWQQAGFGVLASGQGQIGTPRSPEGFKNVG